MHDSKRRKFLTTATRTVCGAGLAISNSQWLSMANAESLTNGSDYRALVCLYLSGGNDGFSLIVPTDSADYREYSDSRQTLAVEQSNLQNLSSRNPNNPTCGIYSQAAALTELYDQNRLAFLANVGTLIEPTTKTQFNDQSVALPAQLFSHSDQEIQWQQLQGQTQSLDGWGALAAQHLSGAQQKEYLTSITLSGSNYWQSSEEARPFSVAPEGVVNYQGMDDPQSDWQRPRREAFQRILQKNYSHLFSQAYADLQNRASASTVELGAALENAASLSAPLPGGNFLAEKLAMVAKLISVRESLGMSRQIFYVNMSGWDTHDAHLKDLPNLYAQLAEAMLYFQSAMDELGQSDNVTTFTASDFGRSLTGNGDGTDHGWGNHHMIMGGAVNGGNIYGQIPRMSVEGPDAIRNGRVIPGLSATQYAATLLRWMGLDDSALDSIFPNLNNFQSRDLGFMNS